jgi:hypothetical protein
MATAEENAIALDRLISRVDIEARDLGHTPSWTQVDSEASHARCQCGMTAAVRLPAFKAGKLRIEQHPA